MQSQPYMRELDTLTPITISKWNSLSKIVLDACASESEKDCHGFVSSLYGLSETMGIYAEDLHKVFKENVLQQYLLERIRSADEPETVVDIVERLEARSKRHIQAMIFFGIIACRHMEVFGLNHNYHSQDSSRIPAGYS